MKVLSCCAGVLAVLLPVASQAATFTVTNTFDSGPGSLVDLISSANASPGPDIIRFDIQPPGAHTIYMADPFAVITDPLTIDGTTQPGFSNSPLIEIDSGAGWWNGLDVSASNCVIRGLAIVNAGGDAIHIAASARGTVIGGTNGAGNRISRNYGNAIAVVGASNVVLRGNSLFDNGGLGIDLGADGVTANDSGDDDTGANHGQNFPLISTATLAPGGTSISGTLNSWRQTAFSLDFYASAHGDESSPNGEGQFYLGSASLSTAGSGNGSFNVTLPSVMGRFISVTATDPAGNTSEFSPYVRASSTIPPLALTVTNTADSGPGSVRQAILNSNARLGSSPNTIGFNIPGAGVKQIRPLSELPAITQPLVLDGYTQPGSSVNTLASAFNGVLLVRLDGLNLSGQQSGLTLRGGGSTVRGLIVVNWPGTGLRFQFEGSNVISGNLIGLDELGNLEPNGWGAAEAGLRLTETANCTIGSATPASRNVISGNIFGGGVIVEYSPGCSVLGNFIGIDATGTNAAPNGNVGINFAESPGAILGGITSAARNVISGNLDLGVSIAGNVGNTRIQGNYIGVDAMGTRPLGNGEGMNAYIQGGDLLVGGTAAGAGNVIAFNRGRGIVLHEGNKSGIRRNAIYGNELWDIDLGSDGVTANDPGDTDIGPNQLQNYPEITSTVTYPTRTILRSVLDSSPAKTFAIEFFDSASCGFDTHGNGQNFLGSTNVTTDASGHAAFAWTTPTPLSPGRFVTATATDPDQNTSELSACAVVVPHDSANVRLELGVSGDPVSLSTQFVYTVRTQNLGSTNATGISLTNILPANVSFVSAVPSQGSCLHAAGRVTCTLGNLAAGADAIVQIRVQPLVCGPAELSSIVRTTSLDPILEDNAAVLAQPLVGISDLLAQWRVPSVLTSGVPAVVQLIVSNAGPDRADGVTASAYAPSFSWLFLSAASSQGTVSSQNGLIEATLGSLASFHSATVCVNVAVGDPPLGNFYGLVYSPAADLNPDNNNSFSELPSFAPGPGIISIEYPAYDVQESGGSVSLQVRRWGLAVGTVSVSYVSSPGTATAGVDYTPVSGTLTFPEGQIHATIAVPVADDFDAECNETFHVRLLDATGGVLIYPAYFSATSAVVTIGDNDLRLAGYVRDVSVNSNATTTGNGPSTEPAISEDGRRIAFVSMATDLVPNVTQTGQIYMRDLDTGLTMLLSVNHEGTEGGGGVSSEPSFSRDGRFVVFSSGSYDLVPAGLVTNTVNLGRRNIFRRNLATGTTELVTASRVHGGLANGECYSARLSSNGHVAVFLSVATDLVPQAVTGPQQLFMRDLTSGTTRLVSVNQFGNQAGNGMVLEFSVSDDGRYIAFSSDASDLIPNDTNGNIDVFLRDTLLGTSKLLSATWTGDLAYQSSRHPCLTPDGRDVAFSSDAWDLVPEPDLNSFTDVFLRDLTTGVTRLVSVNSFGTATANSNSEQARTRAVSDDGRYVMFDSEATDLGSGANGENNVFVRDMSLGITHAVSVRCESPQLANGGTVALDLSRDGRFAFYTTTTSIAAPGEHQSGMLLRRDRAAVATDLININAAQNGSAGETQLSAMSGDGLVIAFQTGQDTVSATDHNSVSDIFVWRQLPPGTVDLAVSQVDSPDIAPSGSNVTYQLFISNRGQNTATGVVLTDILPAGATFLSASSSQGNCSHSGGVVTCGLGALIEGAYATLQISAALAGSGMFTNHISSAAIQPDLLVGNNSSMEMTRRTGMADLAILITSSPNDVQVQDPATFLVTVTNRGPDHIFEIRVTNILTVVANILSAQASAGTVTHGGGSEALWDIDALAPHSSAQLQMEVIMGFVGELDLAANAAGLGLDPSPANNVASASVSVVPKPQLRFSHAMYSAFETAGILVATVIRTGRSDVGVSVRFTTEDALPVSSVAGVDYTPVSGTLEFAAGETEKSIVVPILSDGLTECLEQFHLVIWDPLGNVVLGEPSLAIVSIMDNPDALGQVLGISVTSTNPAVAGNGALWPFQSAELSADGRYAAFISLASNLTPEGPAQLPNLLDAFVRDLQSGETVLVSKSRGQFSGGVYTSKISLSANGRFVAFASDSPMTEHHSSMPQVFVQDWLSGLTHLASIRGNNTPGNNISFDPKLSGNGQVVVFTSHSSDLGVLPDTNGTHDVFVWSGPGGPSQLVSMNRFGTSSGNGPSAYPVLSSSGQFVGFISEASNLVANDSNNTQDVFVRDLIGGPMHLVSATPAGASGNNYSYGPVLSADGRYVAFTSFASDLVSGDINGTGDVFVRDLVTGSTRLVSMNQAGTGSGDGFSDEASISDDGRFVAFQSLALDIRPVGKLHIDRKIFVRDLLAGTTQLANTRCGRTTAGNDYAWFPRLSANGRYVAFSSTASDLTSDAMQPGQENHFRRDLVTGRTVLCSRGRDGGGVNTNAFLTTPSLSANGSTVAFLTTGSNLLPQDGNEGMDLFAWTSNTPLLKLSPATVNGTVYISWLRNANDCILVSSTNPTAPMPWPPATGTISDYGLEKVYVKRPASGEPSRYYRLQCP